MQLLSVCITLCVLDCMRVPNYYASYSMGCSSTVSTALAGLSIQHLHSEANNLGQGRYIIYPSCLFQRWILKNPKISLVWTELCTYSAFVKQVDIRSTL